MISTLLFVPGNVTRMIHSHTCIISSIQTYVVCEVRLHKQARQAMAAGRTISKSA